MSTKKSKRFGGAGYQPKHLGAEPSPPAAGTSAKPKATTMNAATLEALKNVKVPYSSRINVAADQQLKMLAKQGHTQVDLLAEALNLLFKKYGLDELA